MSDKVKAVKESIMTDLGYYDAKPNKLSEIFGHAAKPDIVGAGIGKDATGEYVLIYLAEQLPAAQAAKLPAERDGIRIQYQVTGQFRLH